MSDSQGPGGGALEPHPYGGGFGPPPSMGKHPFSPTTTAQTISSPNGLTDLSSSSHHHLTLLKSSSSNNHNSIGLPPSWMPVTDPDGLGSRLSDAFSEMRYLELNNWDLSSGYPNAEGLTARLVDSRSIDSPDQPIQYRPWEKPGGAGNNNPPHTVVTSCPTTSSGTVTNTSNSNTTTTTNGPNNRNESVHHTNTTPNGVLSTNSDSENKSPPTLTQLTNAFPNFTEAFVPNAQKLPSFQSQFNSFTDPPITGHLGHHLVENPNSTLPSFHTLPANRGYAPPHAGGGQLHHVGVHPGHPHMVAASQMPPPREQQQFLEERHIQLFPGQVPLGPGQFSQLIATSSPVPTTMTITNGHHIHSPHGYHTVMNGTGTTNGCGGFGGAVVGPTMLTQGTATLQLQELVPVPPMHTILHPSSAAAAAVAAVANSSSTHKLAQQITTDGSIPGLNLNIIDPHHPHSHAQHPHHFATPNGNNHLSLNLPKYLAGAPNSDGTIEAHLIAVKLPNANYEHVPQGHHPGMLQHQQSQSLHPPPPPHTPAGAHLAQHHHAHPIIKLDHHQNQRSSQILTNGTNGSPAVNNNNNSTNGTPTTGNKRQGKRKRSENPTNGPTNNNNGHLSHHNNHHLDHNNAHQVSSVSSTESDFKRPNLGANGKGINGNGIGHNSSSLEDSIDTGLEKGTKKKRKRCGECTGCQRKDNCGECAPCRNDKSHQICKQRRCDKLTEKKTPKSKLKQQQQQQLQQHH